MIGINYDILPLSFKGGLKMHIPKQKTIDIDVLSFETARLGSKEKTYDTEKWLYVPDFYSEYRYILGTKGENPLICIGINPSTAEPDHLDNTLSSVQRIAGGNGFDSFIMFNVYAQRATDPDHMEREFNEKLHLENMKAFEYVLSVSKDRPVVWAAWGTIIEKRDYLSSCVEDMIKISEKYKALWVTVGKKSKNKGHPHHPLYLRKDEKIEPFDVLNYLKGIKK